MSLSFDPARDTPEAMARYGRSFSNDLDWAFFTTRLPEVLAPIPADYDQRLQSDGGPAGGCWSHLLRVFLIDEARFACQGASPLTPEFNRQPSPHRLKGLGQPAQGAQAVGGGVQQHRLVVFFEYGRDAAPWRVEEGGDGAEPNAPSLLAA